MPLEDSAVFGYDIILNFGIVRFFAVAVIFGAIVIPVIIAAIFYALFRNLRALKTIMSLKTYALHRNLILSLGIQVSVESLSREKFNLGGVALCHDFVPASNNVSCRSFRYAESNR